MTPTPEATEALATDDAKMLVAEYLHTAFRKAYFDDEETAAKFWALINDNLHVWNEAVDWMVEALEYSGYQLRDALPPGTVLTTVTQPHDHLMGGRCTQEDCLRLALYRDLRRMDMSKPPPSAEDIASGIEAVWLDGWTAGVRNVSKDHVLTTVDDVARRIAGHDLDANCMVPEDHRAEAKRLLGVTE